MASTIITDIKFYLDQLGNPWAGVQSVGIIIAGLINLALVVAVIVFFFFLLFGGIQWITSGGDKESLNKAKGKITAAIIGIVLVFSAWAILNLVKYFFRLGELGKIGTPPSAENCIPPSGKIGNDGGGGCCGTFISTNGKTCDSGPCRAWERCQVSNGACASGVSCCANNGEGCSSNSDCCSRKCISNKCQP